jgi:hypothetical protein
MRETPELRKGRHSSDYVRTVQYWNAPDFESREKARQRRARPVHSERLNDGASKKVTHCAKYAKRHSGVYRKAISLRTVSGSGIF